jgi:hypothetical protein
MVRAFLLSRNLSFKTVGKISTAFIARSSRNKEHEVSLRKNFVRFPTLVTLFAPTLYPTVYIANLDKTKKASRHLHVQYRILYCELLHNQTA